MRISKEIEQFTSGKDPNFQPDKVASPSPGLNESQLALLAQRGSKHDCHSDIVPDAERAQQVQEELVQVDTGS